MGFTDEVRKMNDIHLGVSVLASVLLLAFILIHFYFLPYLAKNKYPDLWKSWEEIGMEMAKEIFAKDGILGVKTLRFNATWMLWKPSDFLEGRAKMHGFYSGIKKFSNKKTKK
jgi:hypothetical protein